MSISYQLEPQLSAEDFRQILFDSTLAERRPAEDLARLQEMLQAADIVATARDGNLLVGIARSITDFAYCCYLSDLAVALDYQGQGIGRSLIELTHSAAGRERTTLLLVAAPAAEHYYERIGMKHLPACWAAPRLS